MNEKRVFVSYGRADGAEAPRALRHRLGEAGLSVWQDLVALQGGRDWWSQIDEALRSKVLQHLVVLVTPTVLERPVVRQEMRLARQEGKQVHPVRGPGFDLAKLPRWMGHVIDPDIPEQWALLLTTPRGPSQQKRCSIANAALQEAAKPPLSANSSGSMWVSATVCLVGPIGTFPAGGLDVGASAAHA